MTRFYATGISWLVKPSKTLLHKMKRAVNILQDTHFFLPCQIKQFKITKITTPLAVWLNVIQKDNQQSVLRNLIVPATYMECMR